MSIENFRFVFYGIILTLFFLQPYFGAATVLAKSALKQTRILKFPDKEIGAVYYAPGIKITDDSSHATFEYLGKLAAI